MVFGFSPGPGTFRTHGGETGHAVLRQGRSDRRTWWRRSGSSGRNLGSHASELEALDQGQDAGGDAARVVEMSLPIVLIRAFLIWLVIIAAETVHGILRGILLVPIIGDHLFPVRVSGRRTRGVGDGYQRFHQLWRVSESVPYPGRELTCTSRPCTGSGVVVMGEFHRSFCWPGCSLKTCHHLMM